MTLSQPSSLPRVTVEPIQLASCVDPGLVERIVSAFMMPPWEVPHPSPFGGYMRVSLCFSACILDRSRDSSGVSRTPAVAFLNLGPPKLRGRPGCWSLLGDVDLSFNIFERRMDRFHDDGALLGGNLPVLLTNGAAIVEPRVMVPSLSGLGVCPLSRQPRSGRTSPRDAGREKVLLGLPGALPARLAVVSTAWTSARRVRFERCRGKLGMRRAGL
mmetsp:Transcript_36068/g.82838  ORF Transcript_36068/g.82838 Transcript_36068/m.82838 type:complete len:215 (-) Transcript_36068:204-848(-)